MLGIASYKYNMKTMSDHQYVSSKLKNSLQNYFNYDLNTFSESEFNLPAAAAKVLFMPL